MNSVDINSQPQQNRGRLDITVLQERFPFAFPRQTPKPLKIGIFKDLLAALGSEANSTAVRRCLGYYTKTGAYLREIINGGNRVDLNGDVCGMVTAEQQHLAKQQLDAKTAAWKAFKYTNYKTRKTLLHQIHNGITTKERYAATHQYSLEAVEAQIAEALQDQVKRYEMRLKLVNEFNDSGLSIQEFVASHPVKRETLMHAIKKGANQFLASDLRAD